MNPTPLSPKISPLGAPEPALATLNVASLDDLRRKQVEGDQGAVFEEARRRALKTCWVEAA